MSRIRIIKKNDEYSQEYEVGDVFETEGTWYGGVHISGRTGVPVSLDKEEYIELGSEPEAPAITEKAAERDIRPGDIVRLYKVLAFADHTETGEKFVVYQALYAPFKTCARPFEMFMSEVDRDKYPDVKQKWRFEKVEGNF